LPEGHVEQNIALWALNLPFEQESQEVDLVAPLNIPAEQNAHSAAPDVALYKPLSHAVQNIDAAVENKPAAQVKHMVDNAEPITFE